MASKEHRGKKWAVRWRSPGGANRRVSFNTERACEAFLAKVRLHEDLGSLEAFEAELDAAQLPNAGPARPVVPSLHEGIVAFLTDGQRRLSPRTLKRYAMALQDLQRFCAARDPRRPWEREQGANPWTVKDLTRELLDEGWRWLTRADRPRRLQLLSAQRILEVWRWLWRWLLHESSWGAEVPKVARLKLPRLPNRVVRAPTFAQWDLMLHALRRLRGPGNGAGPSRHGEWVWKMALITRYTGATRKEAIGLRWPSVDLEARVLHVAGETSKGGYRARSIPLHPALAAEMATWPREVELVVAPAIHDDEHVVDNRISRLLHNAWKETGVPRPVWQNHLLHGARHMLRTHWLMAGVQEVVIDQLLGHRGRTVGDRVYTDHVVLWPRAVAAVELIPPVGPPPEAP